MAAATLFFGHSVAISEKLAVIGNTTNSKTGSAYIFDLTTGEELSKLTAPDFQIGNWFGHSVAIDGRTVVNRIAFP